MIYPPDALRAAAVALLMFDMVMMPSAVRSTLGGFSRHGLLYVVAVDVFVLGAFGEVLNHWGQPLAWYGTPAALVAGGILAYYSVYALTHRD